MQAAIVLHNYLGKSSSINTYCPPGLIDKEEGELIPGSWRSENISDSMLPSENSKYGNNVGVKGQQIRNEFMDYFMNDGVVSWQWKQC